VINVSVQLMLPHDMKWPIALIKELVVVGTGSQFACR
jgi:hypothetical protein